MCFLPGIPKPQGHRLEMISVLGTDIVKMLGNRDLPSVSNPGYSRASYCFDWDCTEQQRCTQWSEVGVVK